MYLVALVHEVLVCKCLEAVALCFQAGRLGLLVLAAGVAEVLGGLLHLEVGGAALETAGAWHLLVHPWHATHERVVVNQINWVLYELPTFAHQW